MSDEERMRKVLLIFEEAIELAQPEERTAFLDRACAGEPELRTDVEKLLRRHLAAGKFLTGEAHLAQPGQPGKTGELDLKVGDRVGPYQLLGLMGEGASSTVYVAEQEQPVRRWVALKVIKAGMDTRQVISRFELERQALAVMDHPGIAKVLDAGATPNGRPFFVMELVRGVAITRHCDEHRLKLKDRLELFMQVCQAVLHAHQKGIVHRDIKPDNVLISFHDDRASPKIIDFGIAKVLRGWESGETSLTGGVPFLGTPAYMSPEQALVTTPDLDTRTDIYSLGALLYELMVGHPPFDARTLMSAGLDEMCRIIRSQEPLAPSLRFAQLPRAEQLAIAEARATSPEELRRSMAGDLDWITLKALEKDRERRYATAGSFAEDVHRHLVNLPVSAAAPTLRYRFSKVMRRNRKAALVTAAFALLLVLGTALTSVLALRARSFATRAAGLSVAALAAEKHSHEAFVRMHISSALAATEEGNCDQALLWLANAARATGEGDSQHELLLRQCRAWLERVPVPIGAFQMPSSFTVFEFSSHCRFLLAMDRDGNCRIWDCAAGTQLDWISAEGPVTAVAWHPDGRSIALTLEQKRVQLRSVPEGAVLNEFRFHEPVRAIAFSRDGEYLLVGSQTVRAIHLASGVISQDAWPHTAEVIGFGATSQADGFVTASRDGTARVLRLNRSADAAQAPAALHRPIIRVDACASKTTYREKFLDQPVLSLPALAADGKLLVTRTGPFEVCLWNVGTGKVLHKLEGMCCSCRFLINPDGTKVASGLQGGKVGIWDAHTGLRQSLLTTSGECILDLAFGSRGEDLITGQATGVARIFSIRESRVTHSMHHSGELDRVALAPSGEWAATAQSDGLVRVWALPRAFKGHRIPCEFGPKVVRMSPGRRCFSTTWEPAWTAELRHATVYSAETGLPVAPRLELSGNLIDIAIGPGCRQAAIAYSTTTHESDGVLEFRNLKSGAVEGHQWLSSSASSLAWDPVVDRIAVICHSGHLLLAQAGSNDPVTLAKPRDDVPARVHPFVAFTPDGGSLISLTPGGTLEVRDTAAWQLRYPPVRTESSGFRAFAVSRDGKLLASTTRRNQVEVWNVQSGAGLGRPFAHSTTVYGCNFSPDGSLLVTSSQDGRSRIWDLKTGEQVGQDLVHPNEVYDATFTPDGRWVLTACREGSVRMWEARSGRLVAPPVKVGGQAFTVDVTGDGSYAVVGSIDGSIHVLSLEVLQNDVTWDANEMCLQAEVIAASVVQAGMMRSLTTAEWLQKVKALENLQSRRVLLSRASAAALYPSAPDAKPKSGCLSCPNASCPLAAGK